MIDKLKQLHQNPPPLSVIPPVYPPFYKHFASKLHGVALREFIREYAYGAPIGYEGTAAALFRRPSNYVKSCDELYGIIEKFISEIQLGYIIPVKFKPSYLISIQVIKKACGIKWRFIRNGSKKSPSSLSLNDGITDPKYIQLELKNFTKYVKFFNQGSWAAGFDIKSAYRNCYIAPEDQRYLGYQFCGNYYVDCRGTQGVKSMGNICCRQHNHIIQYVNEAVLHNKYSTNTDCYIDDIWSVGASQAEAQHISSTMESYFIKCNKKINYDKKVLSTQFPIANGWSWNLKDKCVGIPVNKAIKYIRLISLVIKIGVCTLKVLWKICGVIFHLSQPFKDTKVLCHNLLGLIYSHITNSTKKYSKLFNKTIILPPHIILDLTFWLEYISKFPFMPFNIILSKLTFNIWMSTDASGDGYGVFYDGVGLTGLFPSTIAAYNIYIKEGLTVLAAICQYRYKLAGKSIRVKCDNLPFVCSYINRWSKDPIVMKIIYKLVLVCIRYHIVLYIEWIDTKSNCIADMLSRNKIPECATLCYEFDCPLTATAPIYYLSTLFNCDINTFSKNI